VTPPSDETQTSAEAPAVILDGVTYPIDQMSDAARQTVSSIQFCDEAIRQRTNELAIADTARLAYTAALKRELPTA